MEKTVKMRGGVLVDGFWCWLFCRIIIIVATVEAATTAFQTCPAVSEVPTIRRLSDIHQDNYGRPGLAHMTIAGAMDDGLKEVEVWLQTFAPGIGTPIHRHACEEIFLSFRGIGTLYLASESSEGKVPGNPNKFPIFRNSTFTIPVNAVHQLRNDDFQEDLQVLVIISRPPIKVFVYEDWSTPHSDAKLQYPYYWDATKNERLVCL